MKKLVLATLLAMSSWSAQAVVYMTDGMLVPYDPNEIYVPSGTLGPDIFSIGWIYTDPSYSNDINLAMPVGMPGTTFWVLSAGIDASGQLYGSGALLAGESDVVTMGQFELASLTNSYTMWFSMANFDLPTPIAFGPDIPNSLISAVPEPSAVFMLLAGLGLVGFVARRRQSEMAGV